MIAYLKGKVLQKTSSFVLLENAGIGYKVLVTPEVLEEHNVGDDAELYIYHKSGDDGQTLFGMPDFPTLQFFELLITISGVGPKMALAIVSAAKIDVLQQAISNGDVAIFTRMSGVGKIPVVAGGTGFYIDALLGRVGIADVPRNTALRGRLSKKTVAQLFTLLQKQDSRR